MPITVSDRPISATPSVGEITYLVKFPMGNRYLVFPVALGGCVSGILGCGGYGPKPYTALPGNWVAVFTGPERAADQTVYCASGVYCASRELGGCVELGGGVCSPPPPLPQGD